jgi:hypothetical protein
LEQGKSNDSVLSLSRDSELMKPFLGPMNYSWAEPKWDLTVTPDFALQNWCASTNEREACCDLEN